MTLKVPFEDLEESEFDIFQDVLYRGQLFTGIGFEKTDHHYSEYSYKDGKGHGKCFSIYSNGQKYEEFELFEGKNIGDSYTWNELGNLRIHENETFIKKWSEDSILLYDRNLSHNTLKEYYFSGELMIDSYYAAADDGSLRLDRSKYYSRSGECFAELLPEVRYDDFVICKFWNQLCFEYSFRGLLTPYLKNQLVVNKNNGLKLLFEMFNHDDLKVKELAICLAGNLKIKEAIPKLKTFLLDSRIPDEVKDRYTGFTSVKSTRTLAEQAKYSFNLLS